MSVQPLSFSFQLFKNTLKPLLTTCLAILHTTYAPNAISDEVEKNWYQVEFIIFEHLNSDRQVLKFEDVSYHLPERNNYLYLVSNNEPISDKQVKQLNSDQMVLNDALKQLERSKDTRVYSSGAWQHALAKNEKLPPLKIDIDKTNSGGQHLKGEILIRRGRYMHANAQLYLADFTKLPYLTITNWLLESDITRWPTQWLTQPLAYHHPILDTVGEDIIAQNLSLLDQSRRIKDGEIHYIDHPALGLIVTIQSIDSPFEYGDKNSTL